MRADEVRDAIVTAAQAADVDNKASATDVFKYLEPGMRDVAMARDRVFTVDMQQPPSRAHRIFVNDLYQINWDVNVYYTDAPGVQDRIMMDIERLSQKLLALARTTLDLQYIDVTATSVGLTDGQIVANISLLTLYRLTAGV